MLLKMCGRFCIAASPGELTERFGILVPPEYKPRYNVAPGQMILTITTDLADLTEWGFQLGGDKPDHKCQGGNHP